MPLETCNGSLSLSPHGCPGSRPCSSSPAAAGVVPAPNFPQHHEAPALPASAALQRLGGAESVCGASAFSLASCTSQQGRLASCKMYAIAWSGHAWAREASKTDHSWRPAKADAQAKPVPFKTSASPKVWRRAPRAYTFRPWSGALAARLRLRL